MLTFRSPVAFALAGRWYTYELDLDPSAGPAADIHVQMPSSPSTPGSFDLDDISIAVPATS